MRLKTFPGGIHPHDEKHYSAAAPITIFPTPQRVIIHLSQHIGTPSTPIVEVGDVVQRGQKIAEASGFVSIPQHASISGKVSKIGKFLHPTGTMAMGIEITQDGSDNALEMIDDPGYMDLEIAELKRRVGDAGICGMGGAGFPSIVKLSPPEDKPIDTVILNGVECEPFLTSDYRLMLERAEDIITGLKLIMKMVNAKKGMIGIEANKPDAIMKMEQLLAKESNLEVVGLRMQYPQGAEKQLIYAATKRKVPAGGLPMAVGVVVQNVGTALAIYEAIRYQKPLIDRVISVTGSPVAKPMNLLAPIGTLYSELVDFCGGAKETVGKAISGGPMMGFALPSLDAAMTKGSSGLVLFGEKDARSLAEHTCLRCARCVDVCPMNLVPSIIANAVKYKDLDLAVQAGVNDCIKCGSCAYVCPAQIRLVQYIDTGKIRYAEAQRKK
ncbi:MAG: electron transport complex subunit RsxC [Candidatus Cloacimonetes bacterium]|nr:electron transport complex subunit RsxC [Candidatus Cloacimonadota bacterium]HOA28888.1 electron transport complex subunit RsxC [Candidatus Cloacimonadota bacterium]HOH60381.1 electron transport complex subunit RsxC [Candidatus Cloacimonadota bacterium]